MKIHKINKSVDRNTLENQRKWTHFPEKTYSNRLIERVAPPALGDYFTIKRWLATGDNNFFILSKEQIYEICLNMNFFAPILPSPRHLKCDEIFSDTTDINA